MTDHGFRLSDNEITAKSWPSGAPASAAAAVAAVTPGTTSRSNAGPSPDSWTASSTAVAMANTPGSPDETTATRRPDAANDTAWRARSASTRLSEAWRRWVGGPGGTMSRYGP